MASSSSSQSFTEYNSPPPFVVETTPGNCDKSIIFLHGLGDTGRGWSDIPNQSALGDKNCRWIFPNAPVIPLQLSGGMSMPGWFDMNALERESLIDDKGMIEKASRYVDSLVKRRLREAFWLRTSSSVVPT